MRKCFLLCKLLIVSYSVSGQSGKIRVYFNAGINSAVGLAQNFPSGTTANQCIDATLNLLNNAQSTIDVAMYNTNYTPFVNALKAARSRGVRVRFIADADQTNSALVPNPGFPVFFIGSGQDGIMHNKFVVVDADAPNASGAFVATGSLNWTTNQILYDPNNLLIIQDQSLAKAYRTEFEEMWGGNGAQPNTANARSGAQKSNNTPHQFVIDGVQVESYFSPSDQVSSQIQRVLNSGQSTIDIGIMILTSNDITSTIKSMHQQGVRVRGIVDDENQTSQYLSLRNSGVDMVIDKAGSIYHHKLVIVDVAQPQSDPVVLTGSHNWTFSAQTINDENTLIIHSSEIADLYRKEYERRWQEIKPSSIGAVAPEEITLAPNPTSHTLRLLGGDLMSGHYQIIDVLGNKSLEGTLSAAIDVQPLAVGYYYLICRFDDGQSLSLPFVRY